MMRRTLCSVSLILSMAILAACGHGQTGKLDVLEVEEKQVPLEVLISGGDASWQSCMEEVARDYMALHPDQEIQIKQVINIEGEDYKSSLAVMDALGEFDGIVEMRNVELYKQAEKIVPLPSEVTDLLKTCTVIDGQVYAVPRFYACRGIIYNKKLFQEYGLAVPETYEEFLQLCENLKRKNMPPLVIGGGTLWHMDFWLNGLYSNRIRMEDEEWISHRNEGTVSWQDENPKNLLADFKELFRKGYVQSEYRTTTDSQTIEVLVDGKAAMLYSGTWMFAQILKAAPDFEIGWFFLPNNSQNPVVELEENIGWSITTACKEDSIKYQTAVDFLKFYYSKEEYGKVVASMNGIPAVKEAISYDCIPAQQAVIAAAQAHGVMEGPTISTGNTPEGFAISCYDVMLKLADGDYTVDEAARQLDMAWEEKRGEN